jgi:hypothetical protein
MDLMRNSMELVKKIIYGGIDMVAVNVNPMELVWKIIYGANGIVAVEVFLDAQQQSFPDDQGLQNSRIR